MTDLARIPIDRIKAAVAAEFRVPVAEMVSQRRHFEVVRPRQVAMTLASTLTPCSLTTVGRVFGGRDHTTVMHAQRCVAKRRLADRDFDDRIRRVETALRATAVEPPPQVQLAFLDGPLFDLRSAA